MGALDYRIPALLSDDARRSFAGLARELGVSQPTVAERVKRMEERGVIFGSSLRQARRRQARLSGQRAGADRLEYP